MIEPTERDREMASWDFESRAIAIATAREEGRREERAACSALAFEFSQNVNDVAELISDAIDRRGENATVLQK